MKKWIIFSGLLLLLTGIQVLALGDLPSFPGRIAIIDHDNNVMTVSSTDTYRLTSDGSPVHAYQWPTWARDGRLAYFCCDITTSDTFETSIHISADGMAAGRQVSSTRGEPVIYANWSPAACSTDNACRDLAILVSDLDDNELKVELVRDSGTDQTISSIGSGSPFYTTFSPDGTALLFHRNSSNLDVYTIASNSTERVLNTGSSGTFQTAAWSPVGNQLLYGVAGANNTTELVIAEGNRQRTLVSGIVGQLAFEWSPDGSKVAYRATTRNQLDSVIIVEAATGLVLSSGGRDVFAFWWSPDSQSIALLTLARGSGNTAAASMQTVSDRTVQNTTPPLVEWVVMDVANGNTRPFAPFYINYELAYVGGYFDQFAVSHSLWSPDSRYLVYSEIVNATGNDQVSILDIQTGTSYKIADGRFGVWSWE